MSEIFQALADPHRRTLIARLHASDHLSLSELAERLPISRQAVTKHLNQLEKAGLVMVERSGRQRLHSLDPKPLAEIEAWLEPYSAAWDRRLERLRERLDGSPEHGDLAADEEPKSPGEARTGKTRTE